MPAERIPATVQVGTLEEGWKGSPQEFLDKFPELVQVFFLRLASGTFSDSPTEPTSNVGPWLQDGDTWRFWSDQTASYSLGTIPTGALMPYCGAAAPKGWLLCDGSIYATTQYPQLAALVGSMFMASPSEGYFAVPDLRGRMPLGGGIGQNNARDGNLAERVLGARGGLEGVRLVKGELAAHRHKLYAQLTGREDEDTQAHLTMRRISAESQETDPDEGGQEVQSTGDQDGMDADEAGAAHENMPPFLVLNYIVKT